MMAKFNKGDKVRIIDVDKIGGADAYFMSGDTTHVISVAPGGYPYLYCNDGDYVDGLFITDREFNYLELAEAKPSKSERISLLESQVAELTAKVEALQKRRKPAVALTKSPDEQPKAVIERAKAFVKDTINEYQLSDSEISFVVDEKKRSVSVTLSHLFSGKVIAKAIAKCAPDDVFNADIGKAIALGRALGLDVSGFENAVKPTEVVVGMKVRNIWGGAMTRVTVKYETHDTNSVGYVKSQGTDYEIADDTEAQY